MAALKWVVVSGAVLFQIPIWAQDHDSDLGKIEYQSKCASCHGNDAKGDGPIADQLKIRPADLTQLAKKNGGLSASFPVRDDRDTSKSSARKRGRQISARRGRCARRKHCKRRVEPRSGRYTHMLPFIQHRAGRGFSTECELSLSRYIGRTGRALHRDHDKGRPRRRLHHRQCDHLDGVREDKPLQRDAHRHLHWRFGRNVPCCWSGCERPRRRIEPNRRAAAAFRPGTDWSGHCGRRRIL